MLSQIRQISDGNYNTVFVKNKEQKFNLDKEIHDLECWKKSRNHVYRKEERELLTHLDKLKQQQEYLHHLDEERSGHVRGSHISSQRGHSMSGSIPLSHNTSVLSPTRRDSFQEIDPPRTTPEQQSRTAMNTPSAILPPVISGTDNRVLHRAEAHTNICVICQLPRWSHGHQSLGEAVCCCHDQEGTRPQMRRFTTTGHENHTALHAAPPIQIGQRRHSLMMARLNENQYEHKPRPPERGHAGHDHVNSPSDNVHIHRHVHNHIHMYHDHRNHHSHQGDHVNEHVGNMHGAYDSHATNHHGYYTHHGNIHHNGHMYHAGYPRAYTNSAHKGSAHVSDQHRSHHHSNHDESHTPSNSPRRYSRQSFSHHEQHVNNFDGRRHSGSLGPSAQDSDKRTRDHELHWDRHQVCKLKGMITDPHYKEQLEVENGRTYPWSGLYPSNKTRTEDIEDLKNCRYLRFSKLNLMNMKENPEEEVEVFEKKTTSP